MRSTQDTNLQTVPHENDRTRVTLLKGIAIAAVVTIHILSSIPGHIYTTANAAQYIYLDQLLRFSVPLFIGLSGYALAKKYGTEIALVAFYKRRFSRLVPLYLLWSIGLWLLFRAIPVWNTADAYIPFWKVIILGRGDYHLYFIPLIIQLYLLFPLLIKAIKKYPRVTLFASLVLQAVSFIYFESLESKPIDTFLSTDQEQYSLLTSWLTYFVLGMFLAKKSSQLRDKTKLIAFAGASWGLGLAYLCLQGQIVILSNIDPLDALKFTRLVILPYTLTSIFLAVTVPWETFAPKAWLQKCLLYIGKHSFTIYLSHTIVLRVFFANTYETLRLSDMLITVGATAAAIIFSHWYEKNS